VAKLPPGSRRDTHDRYAEKGFPTKTLLVVVALLCLVWSWYQGRFDRWLAQARAFGSGSRIMGPHGLPATRGASAV
jgi:hypothetical protein